MTPPVVIVHPNLIRVFGAEGFRSLGYTVLVAARLDVEPVPLETWLSMTGATPPRAPRAEPPSA